MHIYMPNINLDNTPCCFDTLRCVVHHVFLTKAKAIGYYALIVANFFVIQM